MDSILCLVSKQDISTRTAPFRLVVKRIEKTLHEYAIISVTIGVDNHFGCFNTPGTDHASHQDGNGADVDSLDGLQPKSGSIYEKNGAVFPKNGAVLGEIGAVYY